MGNGLFVRPISGTLFVLCLTPPFFMPFGSRLLENTRILLLGGSWICSLACRRWAALCPLLVHRILCIPLLLQRLELTNRDCYTPVMHACLSPRIFPSRGISLYTYLHWFSRHARSLAEFSPLDIPLSAKIVKSFLRFRSGCGGLPVDGGKFLGVPRHAKVCPLCASLDVCDEYHLVFDCGALGICGFGKAICIQLVR